MKIRKRLISVVLILCLILVNRRIYVHADESKDILDQYGYGMLRGYLGEEALAELENALIDNPDNVQVSMNVKSFDQLKEIEIIANEDEAELVKCYNIKKDEAKRLKETIDEYKKLSENQLIKKCGMTKREASLFYDALHEGKNYSMYKKIDEKNKVSVAGGISSTKLITIQSVYANPKYKTVKKVNKRVGSQYNVTFSFIWKKCYFPWTGFSDKIAIAWSGGFAFKTVSKDIKYRVWHGIWPVCSWEKTNKGTRQATASGKPNAGCIYSFPQEYEFNMWTAYARSGDIKIVLDRNGFENKKGQIVSQYCHKIMGIGSVTISPSPGITISGAYDVSDSDETTGGLLY